LFNFSLNISNLINLFLNACEKSYIETVTFITFIFTIFCFLLSITSFLLSFPSFLFIYLSKYSQFIYAFNLKLM